MNNDLPIRFCKHWSYCELVQLWCHLQKSLSFHSVFDIAISDLSTCSTFSEDLALTWSVSCCWSLCLTWLSAWSTADLFSGHWLRFSHWSIGLQVSCQVVCWQWRGICSNCDPGYPLPSSYALGSCRQWFGYLLAASMPIRGGTRNLATVSIPRLRRICLSCLVHQILTCWSRGVWTRQDFNFGLLLHCEDCPSVEVDIDSDSNLWCWGLLDFPWICFRYGAFCRCFCLYPCSDWLLNFPDAR